MLPRRGFVAGTVIAAMLAAASSIAHAAQADMVKPGDLFVEPPTLTSLGFEWRIDGDDNRNAIVQVQYRKAGDPTFKTGMPLFRLQGERTLENVRFDVISPNMFAGSVIDLQPDTDYQVVFTMSDPDGVRGEAVKSVTVHTRPEPKPVSGGRVFHVYPYGYTGPTIEPHFFGLLAAYNNAASGTDMTMATRPRVRPGDTILVHTGLYINQREIYSNTLSTNTVAFDGTYYLHGKGTPEAPIVIKAAGDGEVVFDCNGAFNCFNVKAADYNYFEGLTIRNTEIAIWAGSQFEEGAAQGLTVKKCRFENIGFGIYTNNSLSNNFYISDNYFVGRNDPLLMGWSGNPWPAVAAARGLPWPPAMGQLSLNQYAVTNPHPGSYIAVKYYGPGHVIQYNYVANFHDGIDDETYGNPPGSFATDPNLPDTTNGPKYPPPEYWDQRPVSIDVLNNFMTNFHDNSFEADGSMHNVRLMRNLIINTASHGYCNQPTLGGPIYWIRNIQYNCPGGSTRGEATGAVFYNNTTLCETAPSQSQNVHWLNNLMLAQHSFATAFVLAVTTDTNWSSSDYNGFYPNPEAANSFRWTSPDFSVAADIPSPSHTPVLITRDFPTLAAYSAATGRDTHSVLVDYSIFMHVPPLDARDLANITKLYDPQTDALDFRLRPGSAAVDRGIVIPNVTDGYTGAAPDLGALEVGTASPQYGPRYNPWWI
jgi:hypothetical protein